MADRYLVLTPTASDRDHPAKMNRHYINALTPEVLAEANKSHQQIYDLSLRMRVH